MKSAIALTISVNDVVNSHVIVVVALTICFRNAIACVAVCVCVFVCAQTCCDCLFCQSAKLRGFRSSNISSFQLLNICDKYNTYIHTSAHIGSYICTYMQYVWYYVC